jgi:hypothetical protein
MQSSVYFFVDAVLIRPCRYNTFVAIAASIRAIDSIFNGTNYRYRYCSALKHYFGFVCR